MPVRARANPLPPPSDIQRSCLACVARADRHLPCRALTAVFLSQASSLFKTHIVASVHNQLVDGHTLQSEEGCSLTIRGGGRIVATPFSEARILRGPVLAGNSVVWLIDGAHSRLARPAAAAPGSASPVSAPAAARKACKVFYHATSGGCASARIKRE